MKFQTESHFTLWPKEKNENLQNIGNDSSQSDTERHLGLRGTRRSCIFWVHLTWHIQCHFGVIWYI